MQHGCEEHRDSTFATETPLIGKIVFPTLLMEVHTFHWVHEQPHMEIQTKYRKKWQMCLSMNDIPT